MSTLSNVTIAFITPANTNDKDADTLVSLTLYDTNHGRVAHQNGFANVRFADDGTLSPSYSIYIDYATEKTNLQQGSFDITIKPVGKDTWVFKPELTLTFADGSSMLYNKYAPRVCDQDGRTSTFNFWPDMHL